METKTYEVSASTRNAYLGGAAGLGVFGLLFLGAGLVLLLSMMNIGQGAAASPKAARGAANVLLMGGALLTVGVVLLAGARVPLAHATGCGSRRVVLDGTGITWHNGNKSHSMAWSNIKDVFATDTQVTVKGNDGARFEIANEYDGFDDLVASLQRKVP